MTDHAAILRQIADLLRYDPESGLLYWRGGARRRPDGTAAGTREVDGYIRITVNYRRYPAHRIAWLLTFGAWPERDLDHINGNRADNRIVNLRLCTDQENQRNRKTSILNSAGLKGTVWDRKAGRWHARIKISGRHIHLGTFDTPQAAHAAYVVAALKHFGEFARLA